MDRAEHYPLTEMQFDVMHNMGFEFFEKNLRNARDAGNHDNFLKVLSVLVRLNSQFNEGSVPEDVEISKIKNLLDSLEHCIALLRQRSARPGPVEYVREAIPETVRHEVWRRDQAKCAVCGSQERLEFDHIIPVSRGGANTARNIQLLCEACNRKKSDKI
jgi:hypothetical protein